MKNYIPLSSDLIVLDMKLCIINILEINNRRFMYNPTSNTLILGDESKDADNSSHAQEFFEAKTHELFDDFIRGWIGTNKREYKNGIIHFSPEISSFNFDKGFDTLKLFSSQINVSLATIVRGFLYVNEVRIGTLLPKSFPDKNTN